MKGDRLKQVVHSNQLTAYTLPKDVLAKLKRFDDMRAYCAAAGRPAPDSIRLFRHDWNTINSKVIQQSEKAFSAATVFYNGVPIIAHDEQPKPFELESQ